MFLKVILMHTSNVPGHLGTLSFLDLNLQVNRTFPVQLMMRYFLIELTTSADLHVSDLHVLSSPWHYHLQSSHMISASNQHHLQNDQESFSKVYWNQSPQYFQFACLMHCSHHLCHHQCVMRYLCWRVFYRPTKMTCSVLPVCSVVLWARGGCGVVLGGGLAHVAFGSCLCLRHVFFRVSCMFAQRQVAGFCG